MNITIHPGKLHGSVDAIASKSQAHRLLICAAFADRPTKLFLAQTNQDINATVQCLNALGASIKRIEYGYEIEPVCMLPVCAFLPCSESGSTLRFMLPVVGALGVDATFLMEGRLPQRPLCPLKEEMERMGCQITRPTNNTLRCQGKLKSGAYYIDGSVSSQFISGLLLAGAVMNEPITVNVTGKLESAPYVQITRHALLTFSIDPDNLGKTKPASPGEIVVEGDWSNAAFYLAANKLGSSIKINNLNSNSPQGDRTVVSILANLANAPVIDCTDIPDLVPILAVSAAALNGAVFTGIGRLRLKESDRIEAVNNMLRALGGKTDVKEDALIVYPSEILGGTVDTYNDHRIAMSAAIAATVSTGDVTVNGAECVNKSYPDFWDDYKALGGNYEQHIR